MRANAVHLLQVSLQVEPEELQPLAGVERPGDGVGEDDVVEAVAVQLRGQRLERPPRCGR